MRFVVATGNAHKTTELRKLFAELHQVEWLDLSSFVGITRAVEDGQTMRDNALKKALHVAMATQLPAIADDSGLEVDALDGRPGVRSQRFAGEDASDADNIKKVLDLLEGVARPARTARLRCVLAFVRPSQVASSKTVLQDSQVWFAEGVCEGTITTRASGNDGFGYDPIFVPEGELFTFAELGVVIKERLSHRAKACAQLLPRLKRYLEDPLLAL